MYILIHSIKGGANSKRGGAKLPEGGANSKRGGANYLLFFRYVHRRDVGFPCVVHGIKSTALFLGQIADTISAVIDQVAVAFVHTIFRIMLGGFSLYLLLASHPYLRGQHFYFILVLLFR